MRRLRRRSGTPVTTTFLGLPPVDVGALVAGSAEAIVVGLPHGVPYPVPGPAVGCADAPAAVRERSQRLTRFAAHHDFDLDGPMIPDGSAFRVLDAGDVAGTPQDGAGNATRAEAAIRAVVAAGAAPIILGGDDSVPIPALRAFDGGGPLTVLQIDAHLDFRDQVAGVRDGYSSAMRRASEMGYVERIVQVGLRGVGSARASDVSDARAAGNLLVTARELGERGVGWLLDQLPPDASVFLSFDLDGLDPSVAPAVSGTAPGGLTYQQGSDLVCGVAARCRMAGAAFTEIVPDLDVNGMTALVTVRLISQLLGSMARRS
jgi:agmatinase